jgi:5'-nucleotidase/UDP-sugar diphosphatase
MTRPVRRLIALLALLCVLAPPALARTVTLTFVQTNDIDRMEDKDGRGGFARLAAVVKAERAAGPTFFIHSGDTISPSLLSGIDRGAHVIDILNRMGVDVMTPGNHEFDFGPEIFRQRIGEAKFPVVTSNIREKDGRQPANTADERIVEVDGLTVGFYGLTTEDTRVSSSPGDMIIRASLDNAKRKAAELRGKGADIVVAVVHTPLMVDMLMVRAGVADLIFSGHDEHLLAFYDGKTVLTESESQANYAVVTRVTIDVPEKDGAALTWRPDFTIVDTANVTPDPEIAAIVAGYEDKLSGELKTVIGTTATALDSRRATVRGEEAAIGNLIADAMRAAVGADIAITNGGGIRGDREYPAGSPLARGDILAELPFGNRTVKLELTGADIAKALENGLSQMNQLSGRFPQVSGMTVTADMTEPPGSRVVSVTIAGAPLDPARNYTLATNDYMARGGDGYTVFTGARQLINPADAQLLAGQVADAIAKAGTVSPKVEGRMMLK